MIKYLENIKLDRGVGALIGLGAAFLLAVIICAVANLFGGLRVDLTEKNIYTLSKGTKNILAKLENPVTIRYYATDSPDIMSPSELASSRRIKEKLDEFLQAAPTKNVRIADPKTGKLKNRPVRMLKVEKLNPRPNTDAEDSAALDGISPVLSSENNEMYLGIAVQCVEATETIPFVSQRVEDRLEYDLISAISSVHGGSDKKIGIMTSLPISGGVMGMNFQAPPQPEWFFYETLQRTYKEKENDEGELEKSIVTVAPSVTEIPENIECLLVIHPYDITDEAQFAIDQYLLKGGNVMVMVDPNFFHARALAPQGGGMPGMMQQQQGPPPTSDLKKLFSAWGVKYDDTQVLVDLKYGTAFNDGRFLASYLTLNSESMTGVKGDSLTDRLTHLSMLTPGGFDVTATEGVKVDRLVQSSKTCQFVGSYDADPTQTGGAQRIRENFKSADIEIPMVVRLRGNFKTAFPEGNPTKPAETEPEEPAAAEGEEAEAPKPKPEAPKDNSLKQSTEPGQVILIADVDFIYDSIIVRQQRAQLPNGQVITIAQNLLNENLVLLENAINQLSGDRDLIDVRSQVQVSRPFTRTNEWREQAEAKVQEEIKAFRQKERDAETRLAQKLSETPEDMDQKLISEAVAAEIETLTKESVEAGRRVRELTKKSTAEYDKKMNSFKINNTFMMPAIIVLVGVGLWFYRNSRTAAR